MKSTPASPSNRQFLLPTKATERQTAAAAFFRLLAGVLQNLSLLFPHPLATRIALKIPYEKQKLQIQKIHIDTKKYLLLLGSHAPSQGIPRSVSRNSRHFSCTEDPGTCTSVSWGREVGGESPCVFFLCFQQDFAALKLCLTAVTTTAAEVTRKAACIP